MAAEWCFRAAVLKKTEKPEKHVCYKVSADQNQKYQKHLFFYRFSSPSYYETL